MSVHVVKTRVVDDPMVGETRALTYCETHHFGMMTTVSTPMVEKRKGAAVILKGNHLLQLAELTQAACEKDQQEKGASN